MQCSLLRSVGAQVALSCSPMQRGCVRRLPGSAVAAPSLCALQTRCRGYFVRFQPTPNEDCYKFFIDGVNFLPTGGHTMMFDRENEHQSPIAQQILHALPMVEEVTIGSDFVTVKRVEEASAEAAARYFAMRFQGTMMGGQGGMTDEEQAEAAAARSQALQQRVNEAAAEAERDSNATTPVPPQQPQQSPPLPPHQQPIFEEGGPDTFEVGGFAVKQANEQDEALDEAAIQQLIEAMNWSELKMHISALLTDHMFSGEPHISPDAPHPHADTLPQEGDSEVVLMIKELLSTTVRPQLQDDGGDIRFVRFDADTGAMEVELLGACRTCKSSKTTLVDLIERTTRHWIPEVSTVVEVGRRSSAFERFAAATSSSAPPAAADPASRDIKEAEEEEEETDPTKIAGENGVHKRVVVQQSTSAKVVREVRHPEGKAEAAAPPNQPAPARGERAEWVSTSSEISS